ncbi:MAG: zinc ribbon domain-containing protein [Thermoplasmata archaeon]
MSFMCFLSLCAIMNLGTQHAMILVIVLFGAQFISILKVLYDTKSILEIRLMIHGYQGLVGVVGPSMFKGSIKAAIFFPWLLFKMRQFKKKGDIKFKYDYSTTYTGGDMYLTRWKEVTITFEYDLEETLKRLEEAGPVKKGKELFRVEVVSRVDGAGVKVKAKFIPAIFQLEAFRDKTKSTLEAEISIKHKIKWSVILVVMIDHDTGEIVVWRERDLSENIQIELMEALSKELISKELSTQRLVNYSLTHIAEGNEPPGFLTLFPGLHQMQTMQNTGNCPRCGAYVNPGMKFCHNCGGEIR